MAQTLSVTCPQIRLRSAKKTKKKMHFLIQTIDTIGAALGYLQKYLAGVYLWSSRVYKHQHQAFTPSYEECKSPPAPPPPTHSPYAG